jgi:uncharacterized membrane protein YagU involved in acid resistance
LRSSRQPPDVMKEAAVGFLGGLLGACTMNLFARCAAAAGNGREARGAAPGADRFGRGVQPPQAFGRADQDATVKVGTTVYRAVASEEPDRRTQQWLGTGAHLSFGAGAGCAYALLAPRLPVLTRGYGVLYGTLVWALADEGLIPALGLSRRPQDMRPGVHVYALLGHFVYGATLEAVRRYGTPGAQAPLRQLA